MSMTDIDRQKIAENIDKLDINEREREIVKYRYGLSRIDRGHTLQETGDVFGITRERVRQIIEKLLTSLK